MVKWAWRLLLLFLVIGLSDFTSVRVINIIRVVYINSASYCGLIALVTCYALPLELSLLGWPSGGRLILVNNTFFLHNNFFRLPISFVSFENSSQVIKAPSLIRIAILCVALLEIFIGGFIEQDQILVVAKQKENKAG